MTKKIFFSNIKWDTEGQEVPTLPDATELEVDSDTDVDVDGADALSDKFGYCVQSFDWSASQPGAQKAMNTPYFVAATNVFAVVTDPSIWVRIAATTLAGAKRAATKMARGVTFTARVATQDEKGEYRTIAQVDNSAAITRRRPKWRECRS